MNSLVNYGSDDDYDSSSEEKQTDWRGNASKDKSGPASRQTTHTDTNYEEVQMDLSEESNESKPESKEAGRKSRDRDFRDKGRRDDYRRERERDRRSRDRDSKSRGDYRDRKDRDRGDKDRDRKSRRSSSRDRRRSPRRSDRESRHSRSRSRSRDRSRKYARRYERERSSRDIDMQRSSAEGDKQNDKSNESDRFFMPGITGRFRDQIERRKQLWQKKDAMPSVPENGQSKKVWETTTFAQDTDGKVANKFKRLMGIKNPSAAAGQSVDVLKKQEEMFSSMEQQYEVARTATHTMRGVGLGFGSFQR